MTEARKTEPNVEEEKALSKAFNSSFPAIRQIRCLLGVMFGVVVADGLLSNFLVTQEQWREWNPFLITFVGNEGFLLIKATGALLSVLIMWDIYKKWPRLAIISSIYIVTVYTGILYWNLLMFAIVRM